MRISWIILVGLVFLASCDSRKKSLFRPNVLFILVDDLGWKDLGYAGSDFYETPNIDRLASKSMVFTQGYSGSRVCSPSRATLLTGKFTARHGITDWIGAKTGVEWRKLNRHDKYLPAEYLHRLDKNEATLAEAMKSNGYRTFFAGKWHLGDKGSYPEDHGFDKNVGGWEKGSPGKGGYFSPFHNPKLVDGTAGENLSLRLAKETATFIRKNRNEPFFAMLSFYAVHGPIQCTEDKWAKYRTKALKQGLIERGFTMEKKLPIRQKQDNPVYAGLVESMDAAVGHVLVELEKLNLDQNTLVVFTSDNGGVSSGDAFSTSNLPHRGGKGYQWEGGIRVPFLLYAPWLSRKSKRCTYPVTGADLYPTILDFAQIELLNQQHVDGLSLKPLWEGLGELSDRSLYWHYPHYGNQGGDPSSIIRKGSWKLIYYHEDKHLELYNLDQDDYEKSNLIKENREIANALNDELQSWLTKVGATFPKKDLNYDPEMRSEYDKSIRSALLPKLEGNRKKMLSKDFKPNPDWWGSSFAKD